MRNENRLRVFLVEDSPAFVEATTSLLSEIEAVEIIGSTGRAAQAIEEIQRLNPDVVILDIRIAGGSGLEVLKSIKSEKSAEPTAIVFSSTTEPGFRRAGLQLGADFVFDKSQDFDRLIEVIRSMASSPGGYGGE